MLAMSSLCPTNLGWDYPLELGKDQAFYNFDFDSIFLTNFSSSKTQDCGDNHQVSSDDHSKQNESPQGTSSMDQFDNNNPLFSKKLNHNASERERRKKINDMYSSLRALLPLNDQRKKLSIPSTVERALKYIPQLQKEVESLIHTKEELLSKTSILQGNARKIGEEENPNKCMLNETTSCSISSNKLGEKELVIQISAFERISLSQVLLVLEENGYIVIDVSSFQSFGGTTFYNIHLWIQGNCGIINLEKLNEALMSLLLQKQHIMQTQVYS